MAEKARKLGALWSKEKNGQQYFTGKITLDLGNGLKREVNIAVFQNTYKEHDKQPDWNIIESQDAQ